jgi:hypothetical protein
LRDILNEKGDEPDMDDVWPALDAIENKNVNYYVDRDHSGRVTLTFS